MPALKIDLRSPEAIADPYPQLHRLMQEDPVHYAEDIRGWMITRYDDFQAAMKDQRFSSDRIRPFVQAQTKVDPDLVKVLGDTLSLWAVFNDPPMHTRLRKLMQKGFPRRVIEDLRPQVAVRVNELIDGFVERGECDLIRDFSFPLPAYVIADLLGVPQADMDDLKDWSDDLAQFVLTSRLNEDKYAVAATSLQKMTAYFGELIEKKRAAPGDDIIDHLIAAHEGEDMLTLEELIAACVLLLFAGHETTTHFFSNGMYALASNPGQMAALRDGADDPALVKNAINEMLRWEGPTISNVRVMGEDVEFGGRELKKGQRVFLMALAANRDPRVFDDPDRFDIRRGNAGQHITFGYGIHLCLGAQLARMEGEVAWPILMRRLNDIELRVPAPEWTDSIITRAMHRLPISFAPGTRAA